MASARRIVNESFRMKHHKLPILMALLGALNMMAVPPVQANDTSWGDVNGAIVFAHQPHIRMVSERLDISKARIEVNYAFLNTSVRDLDVPVAFPMPPMHFDNSDHARITDFRIRVDGRPVKPERRLVVRLPSGEDVSATAARLGWREPDLLRLMDRTAEPPKGRKPLPAAWFDKEGEPTLILSEYFTWTQRFPAGLTLKVRHVYAPSVETGVPQPVDTLIRDDGAQTCVDPAARAGMLRKQKDFGVAWGYLRYVPTTGNNWQDSIQDFTLILRKDDPAEVLSLCLDGELRKIDPLTFVFHAENYRPAKDLAVLFVQRWDDAP
jgi:hypothetical protein